LRSEATEATLPGTNLKTEATEANATDSSEKSRGKCAHCNVEVLITQPRVKVGQTGCMHRSCLISLQTVFELDTTTAVLLEHHTAETETVEAEATEAEEPDLVAGLRTERSELKEQLRHSSGHVQAAETKAQHLAVEVSELQQRIEELTTLATHEKDATKVKFAGLITAYDKRLRTVQHDGTQAAHAAAEQISKLEVQMAMQMAHRSQLDSCSDQELAVKHAATLYLLDPHGRTCARRWNATCIQ
jgi:hypothetical protein